jgi:sec-independent protein translocase protein TatB
MEEPQPATPTQARATIAEPIAPRALPQTFSAENRPPFDSEAT